MLRLIAVVVLASALIGSSGCAKQVSAPIPNQISTVDGQVYRGLRDVQAAIDTYKTRVTAGTFHPSDAMVADMTALEQRYNTAMNAWQLYHKGLGSSPAEVQQLYVETQTAYSEALSAGAPIPPVTSVPPSPTTGAK